MKIKTLIKKLQKLDPNADIYARPRIFGIYPPTISKARMIYRKASNGNKTWETPNVFNSRKGRYKAEKIKEREILYIG